MNYDTVIVFCPDKKGIDGKFPDFQDGKYLGGQVRMDAAVRVYEDNKNAEFVLVGGYNEDNGDEGSNYYQKSDKTSDMKDHMIDKGVAEDHLVVVNSLPCTRHNLIAIFNKYGENLKAQRIAILTNFYHIPRALRFWSKLRDEMPHLRNLDVPRPIAAETMGDINKGLEYITRIEGELSGLIDIELDGYKDKCIKEKYERILQEEHSVLLTCGEEKMLGY